MQMTIPSQHMVTYILKLQNLEKGAAEALSWFLSNGMSANADEFQVVFVESIEKASWGSHS